MKGRRRLLSRLVIVLGGAAIAAGAAHAQGATGTVRLAFLPQIVVGQQAGGRDFRTLLDGGVVDGPVFVWQRGRGDPDVDAVPIPPVGASLERSLGPVGGAVRRHVLVRTDPNGTPRHEELDALEPAEGRGRPGRLHREPQPRLDHRHPRPGPEGLRAQG